MGRSYAIERGYRDPLYKTDNKEKFIGFLSELLSEDNMGIQNGTEYTVKISDPDFDGQSNDDE